MPFPHLRRGLLLVTASLAAILLVHAPARAAADPFGPPAGQIFQGVAGTPISDYVAETGKHPAVFQVFAAWGQWLPAIFSDAAAAHSRLMLHITTASGAREMITPAAIAHGAGDDWLVQLAGAIAASGHPAYLRLMAEMDNAANPYSAFNANGTRRDAAHSPAAFIAAWRRVALIMRGGPVAAIDAQLAGLGLPALQASGTLPTPQVAMLWVPMTGGSPDVSGNQPANYWPGRQWVDWVGTDFYGKFPNFAGLDRFYAAYPAFPFVFGEWALWGSDDPSFVGRLFGWIHTHPRAKMVIYNQGENPVGPLRLSHYPASAGALRRALSGAAFPTFTPDWNPNPSPSAATPAASTARITATPRPAVTAKPKRKPAPKKKHHRRRRAHTTKR